MIFMKLHLLLIPLLLCAVQTVKADCLVDLLKDQLTSPLDDVKQEFRALLQHIQNETSEDIQSLGNATAANFKSWGNATSTDLQTIVAAISEQGNVTDEGFLNIITSLESGVSKVESAMRDIYSSQITVGFALNQTLTDTHNILLGMGNSTKYPSETNSTDIALIKKTLSEAKQILIDTKNILVGFKNSTEHTLNEQATKISLLKQILDEQSNDVSIIKSTVALTKNDVSTIKSNLALTNNDVSTIKSNLALTKNDVSTIKSNLAQTKTDVSTIKSSVALTKNDVSTIKSSVALTKNDVSTIKSDVRVMKSSTASSLNSLSDKISLLLKYSLRGNASHEGHDLLLPPTSGGKLNWQASIDRCTSLGAVPFKPNTVADFRFIQQVNSQISGSSGIWFPASDLVSEGSLRWWDGSSAEADLRKFDWHSGYAGDNNAGHDCVNIWTGFTNNLELERCTGAMTPMICEFRI